jgi:chaperonin GroES
MKLLPLEDRVIVKPLVEEEKATASGFIIQRVSDEKPSEGIVEAVGPGITFGNGTKLTIDLKPGDHVAFSKFAGTEVNGFLILPYKDIIAVIEETND